MKYRTQRRTAHHHSGSPGSRCIVKARKDWLDHHFLQIAAKSHLQAGKILNQKKYARTLSGRSCTKKEKKVGAVISTETSERKFST